MRKREIVIFVNDVQVCEPVKFDYDVTPAQLEFGAGGPGKKRAEFDRLEIREIVGSGASSKSEVEATEPPKLGDDLITNTIGMKLKLIPAGEFFMGAADGEPEAGADEKPQHKVRITRPFYLGVYEVTQAEYRAVVGTNPSYFSATGGGKNKVMGMDTDRFPVEQVSWLDAIAFCNRLSARDDLKPCYTVAGELIASGTGYRLPTEAEWEYACRAGTTTPFAFGRTLTTSDANFDCNYTYNGTVKGKYLERTTLVGSYRPNAFGLFDMHGNAWEWCQDWYDASYYANPSEADPQNLTRAADRVDRGGGWSSNPRGCRTSRRGGRTPDFRDSNLGFRVVRVWPGSEVTKPSDKSKTSVETTPPLNLDENLITNTIGMKLKLIPAGEFFMGSDATDPDAKDDEKVNGRKHGVRITKPFYLGTTEVRVGQFRRFVDKTNFKTDAEKDGKGGHGWNESKKTFEQDLKYTWQSPGFPQTDDHPVTNVSWNDAVAFCIWLSKDEGETYRLPTEAEWEYGCRAGQASRYSSGDDPETLAKVGNVADATAKEKFPGWSRAIHAKDGYVFTAPVGRFEANGFGLYDMHGNLWEWCQDWYDAGYYAKLPSPAADPQNLSPAEGRVYRGGSWLRFPLNCRLAYRGRDSPDFRHYNLGFRVARVK